MSRELRLMRVFASTDDPIVAGGLTPRRAAARACGLALAVLSVASCASMRYAATFNPTVTVEVEHPPGVGFVVEEVVFAQDSRPRGGRAGTAQASCEAEWMQVLTEELLERGVRVARGGGGQNADAVIAVNVTRCETEQERSVSEREIVERAGENTRRRTVRENHARTRVRFRGTFEVVDPSTDLVAASRTLSRDPEITNSSIREEPEFPSPGTVAEQAYRSTIRAVTPILFRWSERRRLVFFDDERCGLNLAHRAVEAGDYEYALEISIANADSCQPGQVAEIDARDVAAAYYNIGVLHRILGDFESALARLEQARSADPGSDVIRDAIREARSAEEAAAALHSLGERRGEPEQDS